MNHKTLTLSLLLTALLAALVLLASLTLLPMLPPSPSPFLLPVPLPAVPAETALTTAAPTDPPPPVTTAPPDVELKPWFLPLVPYGGVTESPVMVRCTEKAPEGEEKRFVYLPHTRVELMILFNDCTYAPLDDEDGKLTEKLLRSLDGYRITFSDYPSVTYSVTVSRDGYLISEEGKLFKIVSSDPSLFQFLDEIYDYAASEIHDGHTALSHIYNKEILGSDASFAFGQMWGITTRPKDTSIPVSQRVVEPYTVQDVLSYWNEPLRGDGRRALSSEDVLYVGLLMEKLFEESDALIFPWLDPSYLGLSANYVLDGQYYGLYDENGNPTYDKGVIREMLLHVLCAFSSNTSVVSVEGNEVTVGDAFGRDVWYFPAEAGDCDPERLLLRALNGTLTEEEGAVPCFRLLRNSTLVQYYPSLYEVQAFLANHGG